uniref:Copia protein n=1 Tax=Tanacetum cinerariifolium TaxID=118510 RepID=A0A699HD05_TANCI|nr:copia protein [Tanacetum cinerariifolium]
MITFEFLVVYVTLFSLPQLLTNYNHSTPCVFLGYPSNHRGYKCYDLATHKIILSRHVIFDETLFPFAKFHHPTPSNYSFLNDGIHSLIVPFLSSNHVPANHTNSTHQVSAQADPNTTSAHLEPSKQVAPHLLANPHRVNQITMCLDHPVQSISKFLPVDQHLNLLYYPHRYSQIYEQPVVCHQPLGLNLQTYHQLLCYVPCTLEVFLVSLNQKIHSIFPSLHLRVPYPVTRKMQCPTYIGKVPWLMSIMLLLKNKTWELVPRTPDMHVIPSMWIFRHKLRSNGSFERYKDRLVGDGRFQQVGVDCDESFSLIVKPATIRSVLTLAISKSWSIHQLDVKNAFLHGTLNETVSMYQPMGFRDAKNPDYVCLLKKSLYGLKQALRAWYQRFAGFVSTIGFIHSKSDHSLFVYNNGRDLAYLPLYVDDIILTASSDTLRHSIIGLLAKEFAMKDLGPLNYFLGIAVTRHQHGLFLCQPKYAQDIIERAGMSSCKPSPTPVDTKPKLSAASGEPYSDPTHYRSLAGAFQYLTFTRPDISYSVQQICLHMHDPREKHMTALKRILRYIQGTLHYGLHLCKSQISTLVSYTDADWGGCPDTRGSTSGYCVYLGDNLISWSSERQPTLSRSSAKAEYRDVTNVVFESCWLRNLLFELQCPIQKATLVYCDNVSAIFLSGNRYNINIPNI